MKQVIRLALGGIAVGVLVLALKYAAYRVTGSVALYSGRGGEHHQCRDRGGGLLCRAPECRAAGRQPPLRPSQGRISVGSNGRRADRGRRPCHPAQGLSRLSRTAADRVRRRLAWRSTVSPPSINAVWCFVLFRVGRRRRSPALLADAQPFVHRCHHLARRVGRRRAGRLHRLAGARSGHRRSRRAAHPVVGMAC